jgi:hypothetical protein
MLELILVIVLVGVALWFVNTYVPMAQPIKTLLNVLIVLILIVWILNAFGLLGGLNQPIILNRR